MASVSEIDSLHMARALELARRGEGLVEPNPMVGCVIADNGGVIGEGWHRRFGFPHAEIEALNGRGSTRRGAHGLRDARTLLSFRQDAPLHTGARSPPESAASSPRWPIRFRRSAGEASAS